MVTIPVPTTTTPTRNRWTLLSTAWLVLSHSLAAAYSILPNDTLAVVAATPDQSDFDVRTGRLLGPILKPRVPGTRGHEDVEAHLAGILRSLNDDDDVQQQSRGGNDSDTDNNDDGEDGTARWKLSWHNSTAITPLDLRKPLPFRNIIATLDPPGRRTGDVGRLVLAAHYDSKAEPVGFIGATDSAAPCAMLLHVAKVAGDALKRKWRDDQTGRRQQQQQKQKQTRGQRPARRPRQPGLQIVFLDGEEAFAEWTATDSLYGARALAADWEATLNPARSTRQNMLTSIDLFVLLDLLGAPDPTVPSYFTTTDWAHSHLGRLERSMREAGLFESDSNGNNGDRNGGGNDGDAKAKRWMTNDVVPMGNIADDHVPFLDRGIEILHLIPSPFPVVWHRPDDDAEHLDGPTVRDWTRLVTAFVAEWTGATEVRWWQQPGRPALSR